MNNNFLIIVDPQNDFITGSLGSENAQKIVPNIVKKIFTHFGPIIVTMDTHDADVYELSLEGIKLPVLHCVKDKPGWEIEPNIAKAIVAHGNYVGYVEKNTFGSIELPNVIKQYMGLKNKIESPALVAPKNEKPEFTIVGYDTDICVISNALLLRAAFPDSIIKIYSKCCAGTTTHNHNAALAVARSCQIDVI